MVHVDGFHIGELVDSRPGVDLIDPVASWLFPKEMAVVGELYESNLSAEMDMRKVLFVVIGPSWVIVLVVEVGCWAGGAAIGLEDSDEAVAYLEVMSYALLDLGAAQVHLGLQVEVSATVETALECDL